MTLAESASLIDRIVAEPLCSVELVADLADIAIPGGSIVADEGGEIVELIAGRLLGIDGHPNVYLLTLLGAMARNSRGWRRTALIDPREELLAKAANEARTGAALDGIALIVNEHVHDSDPEVRSMVYGVLGSVDASAIYVTPLLDCAETETDGLARGCALGAALQALARVPRPAPTLASRLRSILATSSQISRDRVSWELTGNYWQAEHRAVAAAVVESLLTPAVDLFPAWPAEAIY